MIPALNHRELALEIELRNLRVVALIIHFFLFGVINSDRQLIEHFFRLAIETRKWIWSRDITLRTETCVISLSNLSRKADSAFELFKYISTLRKSFKLRHTIRKTTTDERRYRCTHSKPPLECTKVVVLKSRPMSAALVGQCV